MKLILYGPSGSGKTTKAIEMADENNTVPTLMTKDTFILNNIITDTGTPQTIIIDDADLIKESDLNLITKNCRHDLILTVTDLGKINKFIKQQYKTIRVGTKDVRKAKIMKQYPESDDSLSYNSNIFKILAQVYQNNDRNFVNSMLNDVKTNIYMLVRWMGENGNVDILHYIDHKQLFKNKTKFIYSTIAYGVSVRNKRIKWPKRAEVDKNKNDLKKKYHLRDSDYSVLKGILKLKPKREKKVKTKKVEVKGGFDEW